MAKSLDGIKKLNPDDVRKYRKMILNYIREKDATGVNEQKNFNSEGSALRKVDGVSSNKINRFASEGKGLLKKVFVRVKPAGSPVLTPGVLEEKKEGLAVSQEREAERMREAIKRQEEERKKIKEEEKQYYIEKERAEKEKREQAERERREKIRLEKERIARAEAERKEIERAEDLKKWEEKLRLDESEKEEKRRVEENSRRERAKRQEEIKQVKQEIKIKKLAARERAKVKRQKAWRRIKKDFNFKAQGYYLALKNNLAFVVSASALGLAVVYLVFCLAVLKFKIDNNFTERFIKMAPVPAVITSQGIIGYLDYQKIENKDYLALNSAEKKNYLARWVILNNLKRKYGLRANAADDYLARQYAWDKDLNQIPLARMHKINSLLKGQGLEPLARYADEYNNGAYFTEDGATEEFGPEILKLAVGQVSNIITSAEGYYLVERIEDKGNQLGLKYLFIKARTLDQYIFEELKNIKVFILVK